MNYEKSLLDRIMVTAAKKMRCEKGTLFLYDEKTKELWTVVIQHEFINDIRVEPPQGLAGYSFWKGEVVNVPDAYADNRFNKEIDKQTGFLTRSVLCMPVADKAGKSIGVAQMLNKLDGTPFNEDDEKHLKAVVTEISNTLCEAESWTSLIPGIILATVVAVSGWFLHGSLPGGLKSSFSAVLFVIGLGILLSNVFILRMAFLPGIRFCMRQLLRFGIVIMGAGITFSSVLHIGGTSLLLICAIITTAFIVAHALGRLFGIPLRLATLIAGGTAICGGSAIAALTPVIKASDEDLSFAVAMNTLLGTTAVFLLPLIGHYFGLSNAVFGLWSGTAVNDTAQVVATSQAYSPVSGDIATIIKLTRNALMVVIIPLVAFAYINYAGGQVGGKHVPFLARVKQSIPLFVLGFLAMATLNSVGLFSWMGSISGMNVSGFIGQLTTWSILISLAGIALGTDLLKMRQVGTNTIIVACATFIACAVESLVLIKEFGLGNLLGLE
ncbi:MAG TPA: putative sulfate exporter family transporter [Gallionella sp.]|nr:putative sulfate exporter family transporter [Gallionella sp.]